MESTLFKNGNSKTATGNRKRYQGHFPSGSESRYARDKRKHRHHAKRGKLTSNILNDVMPDIQNFLEASAENQKQLLEAEKRRVIAEEKAAASMEHLVRLVGHLLSTAVPAAD